MNYMVGKIILFVLLKTQSLLLLGPYYLSLMQISFAVSKGFKRFHLLFYLCVVLTYHYFSI